MKHLTVIIRNDAPMLFCGDSPTYRSVQVELTQEQQEKIKLRVVGTQGNLDLLESISSCFLEEDFSNG